MSRVTLLSYREIKTERSYNLDLLRILCMFLIVLLHECLYGGLLEFPNGQIDFGSASVWALYSFTFVAVDCYVLISGYFLSAQSFRFSRLVKLIIQVWIYSVGIKCVLLLLGKTEISLGFIKQLLPISFDQYWFVTTYIGMCLLSPVLNHFIRSVGKREHLGTIIIVCIMLSLWRDVLPTNDSPFFDNATYCLPLFIELYLIAAYIRLYVDIQKIKCPVVIYVACAMLMLITLFLLYMINTSVVDLSRIIPNNYYYRNNSLLVVLGAIGLFVTFLKIRIQNRLLIKVIATISPLTLGVYLIHEHNSLRLGLWNNVMKISPISRNFLMPIKVILIALVVFIGLLIIDFIRAKVFSFVESANWYRRAMQKIDYLVSQTCNKILKKIGNIQE